MHFQECDLGFTFKNKDICVFFGKATCDLQSLRIKFEQFEFLQIQQTHSDIIVQAGPTLQIADAQWTGQRNKALIIRTADCIPAFIYSPQLGLISGIHAGWRGVENQIILKAIINVFARDARPAEIQIWIGPHILQKSFQVDPAIMLQLIKSSCGCRQTGIAISDADKFLVNLRKIVESQVLSVSSLKTKFFDLNFDTKSDSRFNSYRRDGEKSGRNLSFICLL